MWVYAGIDEAGYGPILGPLVVARSVFTIEGDAPECLPSLWMSMRGAVCRRAGDKQHRIAVNDSKLLYSAPMGLRHLERGVLGFLHAAGRHPASVDEILGMLGYDDASREITLDWYRAAQGGPALPAGAEPAELERCAGRLSRAWEKGGLRLADLRAAVVFEDRFNRLVQDDCSKAACSWRFVAGHLRDIWERYGEHDVQVIVDRQGGRQNYLDLLAALFPWTQLRLVKGEVRTSAYEVIGEGKRMRITMQVDSEREHLPAAFASMTAKYLRELLMLRFRAFWQERAPEVRSSAGYFGDGRRFLREIAPTLETLGIERATLVRTR